MPLDEYQLIQFALKVGAAILVFLIGRWLARRARKTLGVALAKTTIPPSMARLLLLAAYYGILLIALIVALAIVGFPITALLGASLIIVVILGIALQQSISNLAATIIFMLFQPFRLGELIDANGVMGTVKEIQFFSTVLVTGDNKEITDPQFQDSGQQPGQLHAPGPLARGLCLRRELCRRPAQGQRGAARDPGRRSTGAGRPGAEHLRAGAG